MLPGMRTDAPLRVFLGHTSDLREHPKERSFVDAAESAVIRAGHALSNMAYFAARDAEPAEYCVAEVERADVFVGIIGLRYGATVRGRPEVSYTELEFEAATRLGIPRLILLVRDDAVGLPAVDQPAEHRLRQGAFRRRLQEVGVTVAWVAAPAETELSLYQALVEPGTSPVSIRPVETTRPADAVRIREVGQRRRLKLITCANPKANMKWWARRLLDRAYDRIGQPSPVLAENINARLGPGTVTAGMLDACRSGESQPPFDVGMTTLVAGGADIGLLFESMDDDESSLSQDRTEQALPTMLVDLDSLPAANSQEPWDRLLKIITNPASVDEPSLLDLEQQTVGLYELETQAPARQLIHHLTHHRDILTDILCASLKPSVRQRLIRASGETAVLGAWMAWDQGNRPLANLLYKLAFAAASESSEPSIAACALAYMSYGASALGRSVDAQRMLSGARDRIDVKILPATYAWLTAREAEELSRQDHRRALQLMDTSLNCYEKANPLEERPWTGFLDQNRMLSFALTVNLRCGRLIEARQIAVKTLKDAGSPKIRALLLLELATAQLQMGDIEEGLELTSQALRGVLATEMTWGQPKLAELGELLRSRHGSNEQAKRLIQQIAVVTRRQW